MVVQTDGTEAFSDTLAGQQANEALAKARGCGLSGAVACVRTQQTPETASRRPRPVVGVIGDPVAHSLSPLLHNTAFAELGLDWVSVGFPVPAGSAAEALPGPSPSASGACR